MPQQFVWAREPPLSADGRCLGCGLKLREPPKPFGDMKRKEEERCACTDGGASPGEGVWSVGDVK
jgi:hypothetical protein